MTAQLEIYTLGGLRFLLAGEDFKGLSTRKVEALAIAGSGGFISVWDTATGERSIDLAGQAQTVGSVAFTPNSQELISGGFESVSIWDLSTGTEMVQITPQEIPAFD